MFDSKFVATLIALAVALVAICNYKSGTVMSNEGFLPHRTVIKERIAAPSREAAENGQFVSVPGTYQAALNPRFSNVSYGSTIRHNMPSLDHQAVPIEPLTFGKMVRENYNCSSCNAGGCSAHGGGKPYHAEPLMQADYASGNYHQELKKAEKAEYTDATDMIPVETMATVNSLGETTQPVVFDRLMFANPNSRLRSRADHIRGDPPIVPCKTGWFSVSANPSRDLHQGALFAMGGYDNSTAQQMAQLINATSGQTTIAGADLASMRNTITGQAMGDLQVVGFP